MEQFRTVVKCAESPEKIDYDSPIIMFGSCFAENMGRILQRLKFNITLNPFGIVYHPLPAARNLERMIAGKPYDARELQYRDGLWHSFDHHGRFSHPDADACLQQINGEMLHAREQSAKAKFLFVTFGTADAYRLKSNEYVTANCHKYPASEFERIRFGADEICDAWARCITTLRQFNPEIKIVFSVSPIRHLRDGAHESRLSKAILLMAVDRLIGLTGNADYFPAYEIVQDDLRDYRFYDESMTHPNASAVDYIWQRFRECYMTAGTQRLMKEVEDVVKASEHRPLHQTDACRAFAKKYPYKIECLRKIIPHADFSAETALFEKMLAE